MAYFSLHAYDADVWLQEFRGLNQADIDMNPDIRFAAEEENVETIHGVLQPQAAIDVIDGPLGDSSPRIETLAVLHRRWYTGSGEPVWYICAAGGKLYNRQAHNDEAGWAEIPMPAGMASFQSNEWSYVTYETPVLVSEDPEEYATVDVLLMSNALDGMIMVIPPQDTNTWNTVENAYTWNDVDDGTWTDLLSPVWSIDVINNSVDPDDPTKPRKNFAVIERYGERIFGTGREGEPDLIEYSRPYDPTDWTLSGEDEQPEDGAGDIQQPSWDGDKFFALKRFGDQLLAFKRDKIWRITGLNPGEYNMHEQYGRGTELVNTICVDGEKVYMVDKDGVAVYDGMNTVSYAKDQVEVIWRMLNYDARDQICATLFEQRYYVAFPTGDSEVNNALLVYDLKEGNILFYPDMMIEAFLPAYNELLATSSSLPGKLIRINRDSWESGRASGAACSWTTPWMDFGYKRIQKGGFDFYFLPEVQDEAVTFIITIQTEKKMKTKRYTCVPLTDEQKAVPKEHRMKRLHFGGSGRKFRITIETDAGVTAPWRIIGGLQLVVETDPD